MHAFTKCAKACNLMVPVIGETPSNATEISHFELTSCSSVSFPSTLSSAEFQQIDENNSNFLIKD